MRRIDLECISEQMDRLKGQIENLKQIRGDRDHYPRPECNEEIARIERDRLGLIRALSRLRFVPREY